MKTFDDNFWSNFCAFLFIIGIILFFPYWFTSGSFNGIDFSDTGEVGDTIGGIMGPFIAIAAAILIFLAFWVQFKANNQQRKDIQLERFETKYFELLRLHRANVEELEIRNKWNSRKAFVKMFHELRFAFYVVKSIISDLPLDTNSQDLGFDARNDEVTFKIAYHLYFYGSGDNSDRLLIEPLTRYSTHFFLDILKKRIEEIQNEYDVNKNKNDWCKLSVSIW